MVVETVAVAVVGWFVSPNINKLIELARDYASNSYKWYKDLQLKLKKLATDLEETMGIVDQVRIRFSNNNQAMIDRLWRLKEAIHDAEDILDSFKYEILEAADLKERRADSVRKTIDSSIHFAKKVIGTKESLIQLEKVLEDLAGLRQRARELLQDSQLHTSSSSGVPAMSRRKATGPLPVRDKTSFFGYDEQYTQLVSMLLDGKDKVVLAIIGHGGMGKTELARQAFRDVKGKFALCIWVHAYNKFGETDLLREICKSAPGAASAVAEMNVSSLQWELEQLLTSKRCLLVLDDVQNNELATSELERKQAWEVALDPFKRFAGEGSKILMTTRAKICSTTLNVAADASIVLNGIDDEAITLLLKKTAFGDQRTHELHELQQVFENNVGRLQGSPLAAEAAVIDSKLKNSYSTSKWEACLKRDHHDSVVFAHLSSYQDLSPQLQRCFAFCSIFPYNWRFEPEKLAKMWIAHGFVEEDKLDRKKSMEDVARGYFDDLRSLSLFQQDKETKSCYVIHEQIHSMIRKVSAKYCISMDSASHSSARTGTTFPATVRHLSVTGGCLDQFKACSGQLKNLRTLLVLRDDPSSPSIAIDNDILQEFKGVRVLDLTETGITELPESIGELKYLRYLGLPSTMRNLCDQVTSLLFLQTFSVSKRCQLDMVLKEKENKCLLQKFPDEMSRLINMRHLDIDIDCIAKIRGIGRLDKLQGSVEFHANNGEEGHSMSELAGMNSLGGMLSIKCLDTVASNKEAMEARLTSKRSVDVVRLEWGPPDPKDVRPSARSLLTAASVLEGLQPHPELHELHITRYPGTASPTWLMNRSALVKLTRLYLRNCRNLQALPAVGGLPCLKLLDIKELPSVERIDDNFFGGGTFLMLKKIVLDDMPKLVAWDVMPVVFPKLSKVRIYDCPLLSSLAGLRCYSDSLKMLVERCPALPEN